eukprot:scaffold28947_cov48-Attheya_sp.AAC.1
MFPDVTSLKGDKAIQVYTNGDFIWAYPMKLKSETAAEQMGHDTDFMKRIRRSQIEWKSTEPYTPWQNRAEDAIRELKR